MRQAGERHCRSLQGHAEYHPKSGWNLWRQSATTVPKQNGGFLSIIPERDVYRLIMRSRLPVADAKRCILADALVHFPQAALLLRRATKPRRRPREAIEAGSTFPTWVRWCPMAGPPYSFAKSPHRALTGAVLVTRRCRLARAITAAPSGYRQITL